MKWKQQLLLFVFQIVVVQQAGNLYLSVLRSDWLQLHELTFLAGLVLEHLLQVEVSSAYK